MLLATALASLAACQTASLGTPCLGGASAGPPGVDQDRVCAETPVDDGALVVGSVERGDLADITAKPHVAAPAAKPPAKPAEAEKADAPAPAARQAGKSAPRAGAAPRPGRGPLTLAATIKLALETSPQIGLAAALSRETDFGIDAARSAYLPKLEVRAGAGQSIAGAYRETASTDYWAAHNVSGALRGDGSLSGTSCSTTSARPAPTSTAPSSRGIRRP